MTAIVLIIVAFVVVIGLWVWLCNYNDVDESVKKNVKWMRDKWIKKRK